jgi:hypothetical protein
MRYDPFSEEWQVRRIARGWLWIALAVGAAVILFVLGLLVMVAFPP